MRTEPVVTSGLARIQPEEFRCRQRRFREMLIELDLPGAIVFARGASTQDRYADVFYLSGFYSHYPAVPDEAGRWRAKGHVALVIPAEGPVTAVSDLGSFREELITVDRVVTDQDVIGAIARVTKESIRSDVAQIGVLGSAALAWPWARYLENELGVQLTGVDQLGPRLRLVKSPAEIELMRSAGRIGSEAVNRMMEAAVPGVTEAEVAANGFSAVIEAGGMVYGLSLSSGPWAHTYSQPQPAPFDPRRVIETGDMLRVDFYGSVDGYLFDFGRSRVVGRPPDPDQQAVISAARDCVKAAVAATRPGIPLREVAAAARQSYRDSDFARTGRALPAEFESWGHSLGLCWEAPWIDAASDQTVLPGMCLAIEKRTADPMIGGATFEENILVTEAGSELLTNARDDFN